MTDNSPELLPCPFCGSDARFSRGQSATCSVTCLGCGAFLAGFDAIRDWNTRAILHKAREAVAPVIKAERDGQTIPPTGTLFGNEKRAADYLENRFGCERWNAEASAKYILKLAAAALARENAELRAQLPDGIEACTILFKECERGHGWLTAKNWVQHPCMVCRYESAESANRALQAEVDRLNRAIERKDEMLRELFSSDPDDYQLEAAIAYTGTEPQEGPKP